MKDSPRHTTPSHRHRLASVIILLLLSAVITTAQTTVTAAVGHGGSVHAIAGREDLRFAFTAGSDGKLYVWDLAAEARYASYQLAASPLTLLAVHPQESRVSAYVQDSVTNGRIITIDWVTGERLLSVPVDGRPSRIEYSPRGTYLLATMQSFESVLVLDSDTGRRTGYLNDGFGVVSFVQLGPNEQNIMTYVPSRGEFIYWALRTGRELQTIPTEPRLRFMTLIDRESFRYLVAANGEEIVVVDNLTGAILSRYPARPANGISYDAENNRILVLSETNGRSNVLAFEFRSGRLRRASYRPQSVQSDATSIGVAGDEDTRTLLAGAASGQVVAFDLRTGRRTVLGQTPATPIVDAELAPGSLYISTADGALRIESDLFATPADNALSATSIQSTWLDTEGRIRLARDRDRMLSWSSAEPGILRELPDGQHIYEDPEGVAIAGIRRTSLGLIILHRDGRIVRLEGEEIATGYRGRGLQDAVWTEELGIVAAKSRISAFDSSIVLVDDVTRETVAAATDAFLTTRLALDPVSNDVYAVGLTGDRESPRTQLLRLFGQGLRRSQTVLDEQNALAGADIFWDEASGSLLSSLQPGTIQRIRDGALVQQFDQVERIPASIDANERFVVATNQDGTLTIWESRSGAHLADLYVFGDEWVAIAGNGAFLTSSRRAESNLSLLQAPASELRLSDFRVELPFEISLN